MLARVGMSHPVEMLEAVCDASDILAAQEATRAIYVDSSMRQYIIALANETRRHPDVYLGASPRGSLGLMRASQARAGLAGRDYVLPDDVKEMAVATLSHRIIVGSAARAKEVLAEQVVTDALRRVAVPGAALGASG